MVIGSRRKPKSKAEWKDFAGRLKLAHSAMLGIYSDLLKAATVKEAEVARRAVHKIQDVRNFAESKAETQIGGDASKMFHGEGWVYLA